MVDYMNQYKRNLKAKKGPSKASPQPGEVWWVANLDGIKDRPILVIGRESNMVLYLKCTSQCSSSREQYIIEDFIEAGLDKVTYVDSERRSIDRKRLVRKMGELSDYDRSKFGLRGRTECFTRLFFYN